MKLVLNIFALFALLSTTAAQTVFKLVDTNGFPIKNASLFIRKLDAKNASVNRVHSNELGVVIVSNCGKIDVQIRCVGYENKSLQRYICSESDTIFIQLKNQIHDLQEYVVTGQLEKMQATQSIQKIRVIDSKRIENLAAVNLKDLLANELNVRISNDNILGSALSIQGVSGQNIKILIDGIPINGRMNGNIDLGQLNLSGIERVEIVEGPMSVIYGTDALGGVINLITKRTTQGKYAVSANSYAESIGQYNADTRLALVHKKSVFTINAGRNFFDGYSSPTYVSNQIEPAILYPEYRDFYFRKQQWLPKTQYMSGLSWRLNGKKHWLQLESSLFYESILNKGLPTISPYDAYAFDDYFNTLRSTNTFTFQKIFSNNGLLLLNNSYQYYDRKKETYRKDLVSTESTLIPSNDDQSHTMFHTFNSRGTYTTPKNGMATCQLGYDGFYETAAGDRLQGNLSQADIGFFACSELRPTERMNIKPGVRLEYNSRFSVPIIPSIGLKYDLNSEWSVRAAYGKGFRAPSIKELNMFFFDFNHSIMGNVNLKPEQSDNINIILSYRKPTPKWVISCELNSFYNSIKQMISLVVVDATVTPPLYTYRNIDNYSTKGISASGEIKTHKMSLQLGYNYTGRYNILHDQFPDVNAYNYSSEIRANIQTVIYKGLSINWFYKMNGTMNGFGQDQNNKVIPTTIHPYTLSDIMFKQRLNAYHTTITLGVKNIFDITNIFATATGGSVHGSGSDMPVSWGRTFVIALKFDLIK